MSDLLYPISLIKAVEAQRSSRVVADDFEDGGTSTRRLWAAKNFKRRFTIKHSPLTEREMKALRSFYTQRDGAYDSFWFRDNVGRGGNAKVRFVNPLPEPRTGQAYPEVQIALDEVAPIRTLPELDEVTAAAGAAPLIWWDANRGRWYEHCGTTYKESTIYDAVEAYPGVIQAGALPLGNVLGQWQHFAPDGTFWAKTSGNVTGLVGTQPACTLFLIMRAATNAGYGVLWGVGTATNQQSICFIHNADGFYAGTSTGGVSSLTGFTNAPTNTWRSLAFTLPNGAATGSFYVNGAVVQEDGAIARNFAAGPAFMAANPLGGSIEPGATDCRIAHAMVFAAKLPLAQVKALHNLLGYQYGLATVS